MALRKRTIRANGEQLHQLIDDLIEAGGYPVTVRVCRFKMGGKFGQTWMYDVKVPLGTWRRLAEWRADKDLGKVYQPHE